MDTQDWISAYQELCDIIKTITGIEHVDLWHEQIAYEAEEYPYALHAVFLDFGTPKTNNIGIKAQECNTIIRVIHVGDTYADTFKDASDQAISLEIMRKSRDIHAKLHTVSGDNFSSLNRISGPSRVPAPPYLIAYEQVYECIITDYGATVDPQQATVTSIGVENGTRPVEPPSEPLFDISLG